MLGLCYRDCRFLLNTNCDEKHLESGAKGEGRSGFRKQDVLFFLAKIQCGSRCHKNSSRVIFLLKLIFLHNAIYMGV